MPSDSYLNSRTKRATMPTVPRMVTASLRLARTYGLYMGSPVLGEALRSDLRERFTPAPNGEPREKADAVAGTTLAITDARGVSRF